MISIRAPPGGTRRQIASRFRSKNGRRIFMPFEQQTIERLLVSHR